MVRLTLADRIRARTGLPVLGVHVRWSGRALVYRTPAGTVRSVRTCVRVTATERRTLVDTWTPERHGPGVVLYYGPDPEGWVDGPGVPRIPVVDSPHHHPPWSWSAWLRALLP